MALVQAPAGVYVLRFVPLNARFVIERTPVIAFEIDDATQATTPVQFDAKGARFNPKTDAVLFPDGRVSYGAVVYENEPEWFQIMLMQQGGAL